MREAFEAEYAKTTAADKSNLARALLREVPVAFDFPNNGLHKKQVRLDGTPMPLLVEFEQRGGDSKMGLGWAPPNGSRPRAVPTEMLWYDPPAPGPLTIPPLADLTEPGVADAG